MLTQLFVGGLRFALMVVGVLAALNSVLVASSSANANPHSPQYPWLLYEWAASFLLATVSFAAAIVFSRGWSMLFAIGLLLLTWSNALGPAWRLLDYYGITLPSWN
jgi:hypothetical protein